MPDLKRVQLHLKQNMSVMGSFMLKDVMNHLNAGRKRAMEKLNCMAQLKDHATSSSIILEWEQELMSCINTQACSAWEN